MEKRLAEIASRKLEIRGLLNAATPEQMGAFKIELDNLAVEEKSLNEKLEIAGKLNTGEIRGNQITKPGALEFKGEVNKDMEYRKAFMQYVLRGTAIPVELRADANTLTTDLGAGIPTTLLDRIIDKLIASGMILSRVTRTSYQGGLAIAVGSIKPVAEWVDESATSDKQKKATTKIVFGYYKLRCSVSMSIATSVTTISAFENSIVDNIAEAMTVALEQAIISGVGTASAKGILAETPADGQTIVGTPCFKTFNEAEGALPTPYENNAVWIMSKKTFQKLISETDTVGQPVARVNQGIDGKPARFIGGREVVITPYVDTYSATMGLSKCFAFLFNLADYVVNTNYNIGLKEYEDNDTDDIVKKAIMLADGKVIDVNSLVKVQTAAE